MLQSLVPHIIYQTYDKQLFMFNMRIPLKTQQCWAHSNKEKEMEITFAINIMSWSSEDQNFHISVPCLKNPNSKVKYRELQFYIIISQGWKLPCNAMKQAQIEDIQINIKFWEYLGEETQNVLTVTILVTWPLLEENTLLILV
jgi:hypothetical protein